MRRAGLALLAALLLAGCGDSASDDGPADPVGDNVRAWFTTQDVGARCVDAVTPRFVREVYGDEANCRRQSRPAPDSTPVSESIEPGRPTFSGSRGAVMVELHGGQADGAYGRVELARAGPDWRIDALGTDLLLELFARRTIAQIQMTAEKPGLVLGEATKCVFGRFVAYSDEEMRRIGYAAFGGRKARERLVEPILGCLNAPRTGPRGMSYLRFHLVEEIAALAPDTDAERCVRRALAKGVSDTEVLQHVQRQGGSPPASRKIARLMAGCGVS